MFHINLLHLKKMYSCVLFTVITLIYYLFVPLTIDTYPTLVAGLSILLFKKWIYFSSVYLKFLKFYINPSISTTYYKRIRYGSMKNSKVWTREYRCQAKINFNTIFTMRVIVRELTHLTRWYKFVLRPEMTKTAQ